MLMQCASSIASRCTPPGTDASASRKAGFSIRSGVAYIRSISPRANAPCRFSRSFLPTVELTYCARTPLDLSALTWSSISAISGLNTSVTPRGRPARSFASANANAGN